MPGVVKMGMTLGELTKAIQQHIDLEMDSEVAQGMAEHALGFFGFYNRIIDNALEPTDRNLFYMFQDYNLLTTESEETTLWDGREWRIHYWKFKPDLERVLKHTCNVVRKAKRLIRLLMCILAETLGKFGPENLKRLSIQMRLPAIGKARDIQAFLS